MTADGMFRQAEITSCGLNGGPLEAKGEYEARIACHLFSKNGVKFYTVKTVAGVHPYFTQSGADREENGDQYIANFADGATAGFKYFRFDGNGKISVTLRGRAYGKITVKDGLDGNTVSVIGVSSKSGETKTFTADLDIADGVKPLYFTFNGKGKPDFISIAFD